MSLCHKSIHWALNQFTTFLFYNISKYMFWDPSYVCNCKIPDYLSYANEAR